MKQSIHPTRPRWIIVAGSILHNLYMRVRRLLGRFDTEHGASHRGMPVEASVDYICGVFDDYLNYSGLSRKDLLNKRVLELGPGDNYGVALLFLACGAASVTCLDKFRAHRDPEQERNIYRKLRDKLTTAQRERYDAVVAADGTITGVGAARLRTIHGVGIEDASDVLDSAAFDVVVSRAVLMELSDPDRGFATIDQVLAPGGWSIHKVAPLHDYQMFRQHGYHPLEFLTVPDRIYRLMSADSGKPNRKLRSYYCAQFASSRYDLNLPIVRLVGSSQPLPRGVTSVAPNAPEYRESVELVRQIRHRLAASYRGAPEEDLIIADLFIVARKREPVVQSVGA